ncbi:MAG TPA: hypothetical protein VHN55_01505 [Sphingomicrobium sp.]|nr:hypothetical protein [Sphingomicrobium sp.]
MSRDEQQDPVAVCNRSFQPAVDRNPGAIEVQPVKVENPVGLDASRAQAPVPTGIERRAWAVLPLGGGCRR